MSSFISIVFWLGLLLTPSEEACIECKDKYEEYLCASNTLPINSRLCIDISEVPAYMYKDYMAWVAENEGGTSEAFRATHPDYELWTELFPKFTGEELKQKFLESDEFSLMPLVGVTLEQAQKFCDWRTEQFKAELAKMDPEDRARFPKKFEFRLPTANEWGRMRFLYQEKRMKKRLNKIASSNKSAFKLAKSKVLLAGDKVSHVYLEQHTDIGFFNIFNNVSEMTSEEGIAMGGSWYEKNTESKFQKEFAYQGASAWVGIRCIFEIIE